MTRPPGLWSCPRLVIGGVVGLLVLLPCVPGLESPITAQTIEVYYAPEDRPGDRLVEVYEGATHSIYIAAYSITYRPGVRALVRAKERGVDVRIITDGERFKDPYQRAAMETLRRADIPIKVDRHEGRMHLKQVVVDENVNTSGSMNLTTSGNRYNDERLNIIVDPMTTAKARKKFLDMWQDGERYENWK